MPKTIYRDEHRVLAHLLRELRQDKGLNQTEFARILGRPQNRVSDLERGGRRIDVIEFIDYCEALQLSPTKVFGMLLKDLKRDQK